MLPTSLARANSLVMLHADRPLRPGTVARLTQERSRSISLSALRSLSRMGVLRRADSLGYEAYEPTPASRYYQAAYLTALADLPIDEALRDMTVIAVFVFGSMTRGGGGHASDIDLLIVGRTDDPMRERRRLAEVGARYGRGVDATFITTRDLQEAIKAEDPFFCDAIKTGVRIRGDLDVSTFK